MLLVVDKVLENDDRSAHLEHAMRHGIPVDEHVSVNDQKYRIRIDSLSGDDAAFCVRLNRVVAGVSVARGEIELSFDSTGALVNWGHHNLALADKCMLKVVFPDPAQSLQTFPDALQLSKPPEWRGQCLQTIAEKALNKPVEVEYGSVVVSMVDDDTYRVLLSTTGYGEVSVKVRSDGAIVPNSLCYIEAAGTPPQTVPESTYQAFIPLVDGLLDEAHAGVIAGKW